MDGPNFPRVLYPLRRLTLTKFKIAIQRGSNTGSVIKGWKAADIAKKWEESSTAKKNAARAKRASLNDYDRFAVMINRKQRSYAVRALARQSLKAGAKAVAGKKK